MNIFLGIVEAIKSVGFIGILLILMSFLIGMKFPDWDFKFKIKHRNILTHSPILLWIMIYFYNTQKNVEIFRFAIIGFALAIGLHMVFDFFPKAWHMGALIHFPITNKSLGVLGSKVFIFGTAVYSIYLSVIYSRGYEEIIVLGILGVYTVLKSIRKEEKFFRPLSIFMIFLIVFSSTKYSEIQQAVSYVGIFINDNLKKII